MAEQERKEEKSESKILHTYPLIRHCDMPEEIKSETVELCVTACEKFANNNEAAAKMIKEHLDKKFGPSFQVVVGEAFGFDVAYQRKSILFMFFSGTMACVIWKCA